MTTQNVTYVSMITTDGKRTTFGVYQATLHKTHRPINEQYVDMRKAKRIASVTVETIRRFPYLGIAKAFETSESPAFAWPDSEVGR